MITVKHANKITGHYTVKTVTKNLGYKKICATWVPCMLTDVHKVKKKLHLIIIP